jgi:uncharacterized membrane protein YphA (DoxX/SURF4 family)
MTKEKKVEWVLRIAVAGEFLGHGVLALQHKQGWLKYFAAVGIGEPTALTLMTVIGVADLLVVLFVLIRPVRLVVLWAACWGLVTALIRPIAGEPIWDFVERFANIGAPLALLYLLAWPKQSKDWLN